MLLDTRVAHLATGKVNFTNYCATKHQNENNLVVLESSAFSSFLNELQEHRATFFLLFSSFEHSARLNSAAHKLDLDKRTAGKLFQMVSHAVASFERFCAMLLGILVPRCFTLFRTSVLRNRSGGRGSRNHYARTAHFYFPI